jgi:hypothetical protein
MPLGLVLARKQMRRMHNCEGDGSCAALRRRGGALDIRMQLFQPAYSRRPATAQACQRLVRALQQKACRVRKPTFWMR